MGMSLGGGKQKAEINMTPMIDVLLVLIIIFMVVIVPNTSHGLDTLLPEASTADPPDTPTPVAVSQDIIITVHGEGRVELNREALDLFRLRERLAWLMSQGAKNVVFVRGDGDLQFGDIAQVIDLARGLGVYHIALMPN